MANPFTQWAPRGGPLQVQEPEEEAPLGPVAPAPYVPSEDNPFPALGPDAPELKEMDTWHTEVRGKRIEFTVPRGATKDQVRAAAKAAGVPKPEERALSFGRAPEGKTQYEQENTRGAAAEALHAGVDFVVPVVDEIASGANAAWKALTEGENFTDRYKQNMRKLEDVSNFSYDAHPWAANAGRALYTGLTLPIAVGAKALQGSNWLNTSLRMGAAGAPVGAANAYASNPIDDRWNGVPEAAAIGATVGMALPGVTNTVTALARRIDQRIGLTEWFRRSFGRMPKDEAEIQSAVEVMAARIPQKPAEMRAKAQEFRDTGHDPTLTNVIDETGRGFVAAMARRPGRGRQIAQDAYDARRLNMPDRIDRNMQRAIDESTADPSIRKQLQRPADEILTDLTEKRSADIEAAMLPIRNDPVPLTPRMVEILDTADGRRAIARAMRTVTDPATLNMMKELPGLLKQLKSIDPRMPPVARAKIIDQLLDGRGLTVDITDRLARKFNALAKSGDTDAARALQSFAREIRDEAKAASGGYRKAMEDYAASSKSIDAINTGESYLTPGGTDEFVKRASKISDAPPPGAPSDTPSDKQLALVGARRAVQKAAGENIAAAPTVANRIALAPEQSMRTNALLDPLSAESVERSMAISSKDLRDFAQIAPNTGSATAIRGADDDAAIGALTAIAQLKSGNVTQAAMTALRQIGVRDEHAARIVEMAVDPARTDELIDMLEKAYGRETALKVSRALALPAITTEARTIGGSR